MSYPLRGWAPPPAFPDPPPVTFLYDDVGKSGGECDKTKDTKEKKEKKEKKDKSKKPKSKWKEC